MPTTRWHGSVKMMNTRSSRIAAAFFATVALGSIQSTAATAQYEKGCQYYVVTTCAGTKWQALGYSSRAECDQVKRLECENGGPIDYAAQFKSEPTLAFSVSVKVG